MSCSTYQNSGSRTNYNEQCLLFNLQSILRPLKDRLGGRQVTCRRANSAQKRALLDFDVTIHEYYNRITPTEITTIVSQLDIERYQLQCSKWCDLFYFPSFLHLQLPPGSNGQPCLYIGRTMNDHIQSLYTLVPSLNNLTSCEAQLISGNLSEVILPVIRPLVVSTLPLLHYISYLSIANYQSSMIIALVITINIFYYRIIRLRKAILIGLSTAQHLWNQWLHSMNKKRLSVSWTDSGLLTAFSWICSRTETLSVVGMTFVSNTPVDFQCIT